MTNTFWADSTTTPLNAANLNQTVMGGTTPNTGNLLLAQAAGDAVGLGSTAPTHLLELESTAATTVLQIDNTRADGDPELTWALSGVRKFTMGVDDSDSDKLKIGTTAVATGTKLTLDASGNLGIGTASPTTPLELESTSTTTILQINNTRTDGDPALAFALGGTKTFTMGVDDGDSDKFKIGTTAIGTNTRFTIDSAGRVAVGTTAPASLFHIVGEQTKNGADESTWGFRSQDTQAMAQGVGGGFTFTGNRTTGGAQQAFGAVAGIKENGTEANTQGALVFYTSPVSTGIMAERMRIDSVGFMGIGQTVPTTMLHVDSNAANTTGILTLENTAGDIVIFRTDATPEAAVTGSIGDLAIDGTNGKLYLKATGSASNTGWKNIISEVIKSYTLADAGAAGEYFLGGYYAYATTDANLTNASTTVTHGGANVPYAAHAFIISGGNGSTDGSDLVLTVTGTSITDAGTRTAADSEVIEATAATSPVDTYFETTKKWLGTVTFTLSSTGGSTFSYDFNYGFAKYEDIGNVDFTITGFEAVGLAGANDGGFNIELLHHTATGWTYAATGFVAGGTVLLDMGSIYSTEQDIDNDQPFAFKRTGLSTAVSGSGSEGYVIRTTTGTNNAVSYLNAHVHCQLA